MTADSMLFSSPDLHLKRRLSHRMAWLLLSVFGFLWCSPLAHASDPQPKYMIGDFSQLETRLLRSQVDKNNATISDVAAAKDVINSTLVQQFDVGDVNNKNFYCIIHVIRWKDHDAAAANSSLQVDKEHWYLYRGGEWNQEQFSSLDRIFAVKTVWILAIHLNAPTDYADTYRYDYAISIKKKRPAYLDHLFAFFQAFQPVVPSASATSVDLSDRDFWGADPVVIDQIPSDVSIKPSIEQFSGPSVLDAGTQHTFDNEGKYFIDFSAALPVRTIKELSFDTTSGSVAPKQINRQNAFGLINFYYPAVDIKTSSFSWVPHPIAGVAFASQPLHKILVGAGWGPAFAQFYAGALWVKQAPKSGIGQETFEPQLSVGINLPIGAVLETGKKAAK